MPKLKCPHFIVGTGAPAEPNEVFLTVVDKINFSVIKVTPNSKDWKVVKGRIEDKIYISAIDWYYGIYLPYIKTL